MQRQDGTQDNTNPYILNFNRSTFLKNWRRDRLIIDEHRAILAIFYQERKHNYIFEPRQYVIDANTVMNIDCYAITRADRYGNIKIDLFTPNENAKEGVNGIVMAVNTVHCVNIANSE